jgi:hypothetical protein
MELVVYHGLEHDNFLTGVHYNKICGINLFCCKINFYKNLKYYFSCFYYKNNYQHL